MILSDATLEILKNFQTINSAIVLNPGHVIRTMSTTETIFAAATVPDEFSMSIGIYDLNQFLSLLSLDKESNIIFEKNYMIINQGYNKIKYAYCNPELIVTPPNKNINMPEADVSFVLEKDVFKNLTRAMSIMGFNDIAIVGEDGELSVRTFSPKNDTENSFSAVVGETDKTFSFVIEAEKLKLIPNDYAVSVSSRGLAHFHNEQVEYWIALSTESKYDL